MNSKLLVRKEYFKEITERIKLAKNGDNITLCTMAFQPETTDIASLCQSLLTAAESGASVSLIVDAYAFMIHESLPSGPLIYRKFLPRSQKLHGVFRKRLSIIEELQQKGVNVTIINSPKKKFSNPFSGRSHIKFTLINEEAYIGGCNLSGEDQIDFMVRLSNKSIVGELYSFASELCSKMQVKNVLPSDKELICDDTTKMFIDSGRRNRSMIFDRCLEIIDSADREIVMTCQYAPSGKLARHLDAAISRGVKVTVFYNSPLKHKILSLFHLLHYIGSRIRYNSELYRYSLPLRSRYLHAKIIRNEKQLMIGSHNYVGQGVVLGTAELAMVSTEIEFIKLAKNELSNIQALFTSV